MIKGLLPSWTLFFSSEVVESRAWRLPVLFEIRTLLFGELIDAQSLFYETNFRIILTGTRVLGIYS
jgi:hypothetical protein